MSAGLQPRSLGQPMQRPPDPPMRTVHRVSPIGHADRRTNRYPVVAASFHAGRRFSGRVSYAVRGQRRDQIPQFATLNFLRRGQRQFRHERDESRCLVVSEPLHAPCHDLVRQCRMRPAPISSRCRRTLPRRAPYRRSAPPLPRRRRDADEVHFRPRRRRYSRRSDE